MTVPPEKSAPCEPGFSPETLAIFERAFRIADGLVEELHLMMGLDLQKLPSIEPGFKLRDLLNRPIVTRQANSI